MPRPKDQLVEERLARLHHLIFGHFAVQASILFAMRVHELVVGIGLMLYFLPLVVSSFQ